jgi:hypothetical protein
MLTGFLTWLVVSQLSFAADYRFIKIDFPNANQTITSGINARGDIAGRMQDAGGVDHAFLLHDGHFTQIDFPGAVSTIGRGINDAGDVTGNYTDSSETEIGFVLQDGKFRSVLADPCSSDVWSAMDNGQVLVGDNCAGPDEALYGFLQDKKGKFHTISFPSGGSFPCSGLRWINEKEEMVGLYAVANNFAECYGAEVIHGFLLRNEKYIAFDVPGAVVSNPLAINDDDLVVGYYTDKNGVTHGFKAVPKDDQTGER